jgi:hypothetical protein
MSAITFLARILSERIACETPPGFRLSLGGTGSIPPD